MMQKNEFLDFLKKGSSLLGIELNSSPKILFNLLGKPVNIVGDKKVGFYEFEQGVRYGYIADSIDELGVIFYGNENIKIPIDVKGEDEKYINENTTINVFIRILNNAGIIWSSCDEKNLNVFCIKTEGNVFILFDLETGKVSKVGISRE